MLEKDRFPLNKPGAHASNTMNQRERGDMQAIDAKIGDLVWVCFQPGSPGGHRILGVFMGADHVAQGFRAMVFFDCAGETSPFSVPFIQLEAING